MEIFDNNEEERKLLLKKYTRRMNAARIVVIIIAGVGIAAVMTSEGDGAAHTFTSATVVLGIFFLLGLTMLSYRSAFISLTILSSIIGLLSLIGISAAVVRAGSIIYVSPASPIIFLILVAGINLLLIRGTIAAKLYAQLRVRDV